MIALRYFLVGGVAASSDFLLFFIAVSLLEKPWFPSAIFSFVFATLVNYVLSINFVFESGARFKRNVEIPMVFLASLIGLALNQFFLWIFIAGFGLHVLISKVTATFVVFLWNYWARSRFIFLAR